MTEADRIIEALGLVAHPEGGHFRETFRDTMANGRAHSTAIFYLLKAGEVSRWHRVDSAEIWHWYAGAPLTLSQRQTLSAPIVQRTMGGDVLAGQTPQAIVPALVWQSACSLGPWTLVGCTVAPGFEFTGFELAPEDFVDTSRALRCDPA